MTKTLVTGGRLVDPQSGRDEPGVLAIADGRIVASGRDAPRDFHAERTIDVAGAVVAPGLVDLCARLGEPGHEHEGMLESELAAAVAGGVTSVVCPPDTDPVLDEPGLVEMLKFRARSLDLARVFPLGALTRGLGGEAITEMAELTEAGCIGFGQADVAIRDTLVLHRALQYAATFGFTVWLRPNDAWLGQGPAGDAHGPLGRAGARRDDRHGDPLRAGSRHRRARSSLAPEQCCRRRARAPGQGRRPARGLRRQHPSAPSDRRRHGLL